MSYLEIPSGKVGDSSLGGIFVHAVDGEKICISQSANGKYQKPIAISYPQAEQLMNYLKEILNKEKR